MTLVLPSVDDERTIANAIMRQLVVTLADRVYWVDDPDAVHAALSRGIARLFLEGATLCRPSFKQRRRILTRRRIAARAYRRGRVIPLWWPIPSAPPLAKLVVLEVPLLPARAPREADALRDLDGWIQKELLPGATETVGITGRILRVELVAEGWSVHAVVLKSLRARNVEYLSTPVVLHALPRDEDGLISLGNRIFGAMGIEDIALEFMNADRNSVARVAVRAWGPAKEVNV